MVVFITVLKEESGQTYEHVRRLWNSIIANSTKRFKFIVVTDMDVDISFAAVIPSREKEWNGRWSKMEVFYPGLFASKDDTYIYLDLEMVMQENIDVLMKYPHRFTMLEDFRYDKRKSAQIMAWTGDYSFLYNKAKEVEDTFAGKPKHRQPWEQKFIEECLGELGIAIQTAQNILPITNDDGADAPIRCFTGHDHVADTWEKNETKIPEIGDPYPTDVRVTKDSPEAQPEEVDFEDTAIGYDRPLLISGIPRSGNSTVAAMVSACGVFGGVLTNNRYDNTPIRQRIIKPLLKRFGGDVLGQNPLPSINEPAPNPNLRGGILRILRDQGYQQGTWFLKEPKLCLLHKMWHRSYPNAIWLFPTLPLEQIAASCVKTKYMARFFKKEEWLEWASRYTMYISAVLEDGASYFFIDSEKIFKKDFGQVKEVLEECGLAWNEDAVVNELHKFGLRF